METTLEIRKKTMVEELKQRATSLQPKTEFEEICVMLIDVSSSMEDLCENGQSKLENVKQSLIGLRAQGSYIAYGMVAFSTLSFPITPPTTNFNRLLVEAQSLQSYDMTNIPGAMREGLGMLRDRPSEKKRMILLTDGHNNEEGLEMDRMIEHCVGMGVIVDTIGFGEGADEVLLMKIAERTGGIYKKALSVLQLAESYKGLNFNVRWIEHKK